MRPSIPLSLLLLFLLFLLLPFYASAAPDGECKNPVSIQDACKAASSVARAEFSYDFCVTALRTAAGAASTDLRGLATAAIRQTLAVATSTQTKLEDLLELEPEARERDCLDACAEAYGDAIDGLRDALDNLNAGVDGMAMTRLSAALDPADSCEEAYKMVDGAASPVVSEGKDYRRLAGIALALTTNIE